MVSVTVLIDYFVSFYLLLIVLIVVVNLINVDHHDRQLKSTVRVSI